ncbi:MAG: hypothetical protein C5S48_08020 [Candidatus Methanogaster sp.]|nr:MAG: hypothetical protein C5S48_08020 [ANME-2 cluster archaeon]
MIDRIKKGLNTCKTSKISDVVLGLVGFIFLMAYISSDLMCTNSNPEMTVFQTGLIKSIKVVGLVLTAVVCDFLFPLYIIYSIISKINDWKRKRQFRIKTDANINRLAVLLITLALVSGLWLVWLSFSFGFINNYPSSENIIIDEPEQVIKIQRQYLLKSDENLLIPFNEVDHVIYRSEVWCTPPLLTVEVIKTDGTKIEIHSDVGVGGGTLRDLAKAIAKTSGKRLERERVT